ncbi:MAG: AglZ/HisF2 family acetamidino modification protein [Verrucomicrobiota bacterium]|nr:AglZ/HisF2 family acetamidino modification protein [Verrucomicrobiota bacterium]
MLKHRVIPTLLIQNGDLIKTSKFKNAEYIGDPVNAIKIFNEKEVDELIVLDVSKSKEKLEPDYDLIEEFAGECFMPLTYGGGIKTLEQAGRIFRLGVEKICINSLCFQDVSIIKSMVKKFGSQSIVASIDVKKTLFGRYKLYDSSSSCSYDAKFLENHLQQLLHVGVGEIMLGSIDKDGTLSGPDLNIIKKVSEKIRIPLISIGGVSSLEDIKNSVLAGASAVAAGAFFVFHGKRRAVLITYPSYQELEALLN